MEQTHLHILVAYFLRQPEMYINNIIAHVGGGEAQNKRYRIIQ